MLQESCSRFFSLLVIVATVGLFHCCQRSEADEEFDMQRYHHTIEKLIVKKTIHLHRGSVGKKTVVRFVLLRDGTLAEVRVFDKSDSAEHNALAVQTVKACAPFPKFPVGGPQREVFCIDINYNACTWTVDRCEPAKVGPTMDSFLNRLAHEWHPPPQNSLDLVFLKFKVNTEGAIVNAEIDRAGRYFTLQDLNPFSTEASALTQAKRCLSGAHIIKGTQIESITVLLVYEPRPYQGTHQNHLVGTNCGPIVDEAHGTITYFDPPLECPTP